jgi:chorismate mutase/prephenate dehydratase
MVALLDKVGALHDMLIPFKDHNVNMTRIESRPSRRKAWEYYFFLDFEGYYKDRNPARCLKDLREATKEVKILGSYPQTKVIF